MSGAEAKERRKRLGLTLYEVCVPVGISDTSLRLFEKGVHKPLKGENMERLEKALAEAA